MQPYIQIETVIFFHVSFRTRNGELSVSNSCGCFQHFECSETSMHVRGYVTNESVKFNRKTNAPNHKIRRTGPSDLKDQNIQSEVIRSE